MSRHHDIQANDIKPLIGVDMRGKIVDVPVVVMRKLKGRKQQKELLRGRTGICIVCNFAFYDKPVTWHDGIKAICHPFRDTKPFPNNKDFYLLSESDFCDRKWIHHTCEPDKKNWDFIWFTQDQAQGVRCKGLHTIEVIDQAAREVGLKGLVVDYCKRPQIVRGKNLKSWDKDLLEIRKYFSKMTNLTLNRKTFNCEEMCEYTKRSKFMLFPNTRDASPRMIPEALIKGCPVVVNRNIYGGWKYVSDSNGMLFDGPMTWEQVNSNKSYYKDEFIGVFSHMKENAYEPSDVIADYESKFGFLNASKSLANVVNNIIGSQSYQLVAYAEFKKLLKKMKGRL